MSESDDMVLRRADYALSDEQEAVRDAFASALTRQCPPERVRESEPLGFDEKLWRQLVDMRSVAMGVPEASGGDGAGLEELVLVAEQHGLHMAPVPFVETAAAARLLARVTDAAAAGAHLEAAMSGEQIVSLALHPGPGPQLVPAGAVADTVVGLDGDDLVAVTRQAHPPAVANQGSSPLAWWDLGAAGGTRSVLAHGPDAHAQVATARQEWKLLMAAAQVGLAEGAHRIAVDFAKERMAFGVPIGSFQAVAHPLVDVAMAITSARRLVGKAAWFSEHEPAEAARLVAMAYLFATRTANRSATVGVHTQGGLGFTLESDEQMFFRRAKGWALVGGDPTGELALIADQRYGPIPA